MNKLYSDFFLRQIRNDININILIEELDIPNKHSEGYLRFLCPVCNEFNTATKKETNLGRCFLCKKNFNPIDMVMVVKKINFVEAVNFLKSFSTVTGKKIL